MRKFLILTVCFLIIFSFSVCFGASQFGDVRNTKVAELIGILSKSIGKIECYDPLVDPNEVKKTYGLNIIISQEDISGNDYDMAIIAVKHKCIKNLQYTAKTTIKLEDYL